MVSGSRLELTRSQVLAFRRKAGALDERLAWGEDSLRQAAWAGLQDSMPRAALLSIHARVEGADSSAWEHPSLVQLWGPRHAVYVVPGCDLALFSLGIMPDHDKGQRRAREVAAQLAALLSDGTRMTYAEAARALGEHHGFLQYGATTGTVLIRWEGARAPKIWSVPPPEMEAGAARLELARRYLHIYGPTTGAVFGRWAGIGWRAGEAAFDSLGASLMPVRTPIGDGWMLASDETTVRAGPAPTAKARLLPSGDSFLLFHEGDRDLLVPDPRRRDALWTPRVWPGGVLVNGEVEGTWRRAGAVLTMQPWRPLSASERDAVVTEAEGLPLPGLEGKRIVVRWDDPLG